MLAPMERALTLPSQGVLISDLSPTFNVVTAYEDFETGKHAKKTYDYLVENLGLDVGFSNQMWKFDVLSIPKLREIAARDAVAADVILVSSHGGSDLPPQVRAWIDSWVSQKSNAIALVALFDRDVEESAPVRSYLAEIARQAQLGFFAQPDDWPGSHCQPDDPGPHECSPADQRPCPHLPM